MVSLVAENAAARLTLVLKEVRVQADARHQAVHESNSEKIAVLRAIAEDRVTEHGLLRSSEVCFFHI